MVRSLLLVLVLLVPDGSEAAESKVHGNPIRRVVTMLQEMQKEVEREGETEQELYDKSICYCQKTGEELAASIDSGDGKISELSSQVEEDSAVKTQLDQAVVEHKADRADAEKSISESTAMRQKEAAEFATESGEMKANIVSVDGALGALRKGLGSALLQSGAGDIIRNVVRQSPLLGDGQREVLASFLQSGGQDTSSSGGSDQILGILETMLENMQEDLKETKASEAGSVTSYNELMAAKNTELNAATKGIESKMARSGELAVSIATAQADLEGTTTAVAEDTKMKVNLGTSCATKTKEYDGRRATRAEEMTALSETVKILNADDSLDTFKKTMPSPGEAAASFLQVGAERSEVGRARHVLHQVAERLRSTNPGAAPQLGLVLLQIRQNTQGDFGHIVTMIDKMIALLGREQGDDDKQKEFCTGELDKAAQDKANTQEDSKSLDTAIEQTNGLIENCEAEITSLQAGVADLDTSVAQATDQRKKEHAEFTATSQANQAAIDLLDMAKNRMNKFYNPTMYNPNVTPPPSPYGFLEEPASLVQVRAHARRGGGVVQLLAQMIGDVEQDMALGKKEEGDGQKEYEEVMADATAKRSTDSKLLVTKETWKADLVSKLDDAKSDRGAADEALQGLLVKIGDLHASCDFLLDNYDLRKEARTAEIEGLHQGKAVLGSAGDSGTQAAAGFLQRSA